MVEAARKGRDSQSDCEVWPDLWPAVQTFTSMSTQWQTSITPTGRLVRHGLLYASLPLAMDEHCIEPADRPQVIADIRFMERVALPLVNQKAEQDNP